MLSQQQIQEIARKQAQRKQDGAALITAAGVILVMIACYGMMFTNNIDYVVILIFGFIVAMFGFISLKE
jgi:hypothetical protein